MQPLRIVVCGTNYARFYLSAIRAHQDRYLLVGILAQGSARSLRVADRWGVPLFRRVSELPADIDIACSALGISASDVVLQLLEKGIHVLCEHPQQSGFLERAFEIHQKRHVCLHVNAHFGDLPAARAFVRFCSGKRKTARPALVRCIMTDRFLYGALDILRQAVGCLTPFEFERECEIGRILLFRGTLGGIPASLHIENSVTREGTVLPDGSTDYLSDLRLTLTFPDGVLSLLSVGGPVIWNRNLAMASTKNLLSEHIYADPALTPELLKTERIQANSTALNRLVSHVRKGWTPAEQSQDHLLEIAQLWEHLGKQLAD